MKTNRFEENLRRKLESLKPDFQEQDWDKFQAFQQHAAPSFWQTYGHWLGYAVAVVTTATVAVLYFNQSRQNDALLREMKELREQVVAGNEALAGKLGVVSDSIVTDMIPLGQYAVKAPSIVQSDTVYIIAPRVIYRDRPVYELSTAQTDQSGASGSNALATEENPDEREIENSEKLVVSSRTERAGENVAEDLPQAATKKITRSGKEISGIEASVDARPFEPKKSNSGDASPEATSPNTTPLPIDNLPQGRLPQESLALDGIRSLPTPSLPEVSKTQYRRLMNRMPKTIRKRETPLLAKSQKGSESKVTPPNPASAESTKKVAKEESLLPKFGLNLPFRVGAGQQWEGHTRAFSLWNEVLFGEHWSIQGGLSWQKLEDQKFFDERIFKEKMRSDFREDHADKLPRSFDIFNISTSTKVTTIPLNLLYRNEIGRDFSYFVGAGTNVNLRAEQTLSFDFKRPSKDYGQESKKRNIAFPLINNVNALIGVEKRWSPIVLQVSTFLTTRFKTFPFLDDRTDAGLQVKVLYEFRADKKK